MDALLVANYLTRLKEKTGLTYEAIAEKTGLSLSTVKNLFSGKSEDPRLNTVAPVIYILNGSVDEMYSGKPKETLQEISVASLKEMYEFQLEEHRKTSEAHINNIRAHYEQHREDTIANYEHRLADKREIIKDKNKLIRFLTFSTCICAFVLVALLVLEVANPSLGWLRF